MKLKELFDVFSGSSLDLNKMTQVSTNNPNNVNFVSRSAKNQGVVAQVEQIKEKKPFSAGLISVALGGSALSSFVQQYKFYTGEHMRVLHPKKDLTLNEKLFYCLCIKRNDFRYTAYGREADRSIQDLDLPNEIPSWVNDTELINIDGLSKPIEKNNLNPSKKKWLSFRYDELFYIERGKGARKTELKEQGKTPFITSIASNNGLVGMVDAEPMHEGNVISVNRNGSVGEAFYQPLPFCSTEDVHIFKPKFELNQYRAMFLIGIISKEKYRYSFGRKWGINRMNETIMMLPVDDDNKPDWQFMEDYIKSLSYSSNLEN